MGDPGTVRQHIARPWAGWSLDLTDPMGLHSRESSLALLHVFALGSGPSFATQVNSNAHEQATLVQEVASNVHDHQEQDEDDNEDAHDGTGAQACGGAAVGLSRKEMVGG